MSTYLVRLSEKEYAVFDTEAVPLVGDRILEGEQEYIITNIHADSVGMYLDIARAEHRRIIKGDLKKLGVTR